MFAGIRLLLDRHESVGGVYTLQPTLLQNISGGVLPLCYARCVQRRLLAGMQTSCQYTFAECSNAECSTRKWRVVTRALLDRYQSEHFASMDRAVVIWEDIRGGRAQRPCRRWHVKTRISRRCLPCCIPPTPRHETSDECLSMKGHANTDCLC